MTTGNNGGTPEEASLKVPSKDRKKKKNISYEELTLKEKMELCVERIKDSNPDLQKAALESMGQEIRASTNTITLVPKPVEFLRPHYKTLKAHYDAMADSYEKKYLADILSVLAMTMLAEGEGDSLKYRLLGLNCDIGSWGHEYVRNLARAIVMEKEKGEETCSDYVMDDDVKDQGAQIGFFYLKNNAVPELVDMMMEIGEVDLVKYMLDDTNYKRPFMYLTSCARYLPRDAEKLSLDTVYKIFSTLEDYPSALRVALFVDNMEDVRELFTYCDDPLQRKQLCYIIGRHGIPFDFDELIKDDDERDALENIVHNTRLSEGYLTLARDIDVMEPKSPEDVFKGTKDDDTFLRNLAATFVNAFVNAGFGQDMLMIVPSECSSGDSISSWLFMNKEHGKASAAASLGLILLWDVDFDCKIFEYLKSNDNYVIAGALLAVGIVKCRIKHGYLSGKQVLCEYIGKEDSTVQIGAIWALASLTQEAGMSK